MPAGTVNLESYIKNNESKIDYKTRMVCWQWSY